MTSDEIAATVDSARRAAGVSWAELAELVGRPPVWTVAALQAQHPLSAEQAVAVGDRLGLNPGVVAALQAFPSRGAVGAAVPVDPTVYRLYEVVQVYGPALKALIHEQFGDGIMSAINFSLDVQRVPHPDGDRVRIVMDGKFLPYQWGA
jgi:cyanate lyase